jgi:hypothetical protein
VLPLRPVAGMMITSMKDGFVWDVKNDRMLAEPGAIGSAHGLTLSARHLWPYLSPDGAYLIDHWPSDPESREEVAVWNVSTAKEHCRLRVTGGTGGSIMRDERTLLHCSTDGKRYHVQFWDITDGHLIQTRELKGLRVKEQATFPPALSVQGINVSGRFLALTFPLAGRRLWYDLQADRLLAAGDYVTPDGRKVLSLNAKERALTIADVSGRSVTVPVAVEDVLFDWSVDGETMFTANLDSTFSCWDSRTGQERVRFEPGLRAFARMAVSPRGDAVALGDETGSVAVIRASFLKANVPGEAPQ